MKKLTTPFYLSIVIFVFTLSCNSNKGESTIKKKPIGYVLKSNEGEILMGDSVFIAKVSPEMGSQSDITITAKIPPGKSSGLHYHQNEDEIFYIIEGRGVAILGEQSYPIETGDIIFIPKGFDHQIQNKDTINGLKLLFFMDKPGLLQQFREEHQQFSIEKKPLSVEALNAISKKYGTHYKTVD